MTDEQKDAIWDQRCQALHKAWVQLRYHRKRQRFWDMADKITKSLTVFLGASLLGEAFKEQLPLVASAISVLGLLALVFGYSDRKQQHRELGEAFASLVSEIEKVPPLDLDAQKAADWRAGYARLCAKAPPQLRWLTLACEREQSTADGHPDHVPALTLFQKMACHFV